MTIVTFTVATLIETSVASQLDTSIHVLYIWYRIPDTKQIITRRRNGCWHSTGCSIKLTRSMLHTVYCCEWYILPGILLVAMSNGQNPPHQHLRNNSEHQCHSKVQSATHRKTIRNPTRVAQSPVWCNIICRLDVMNGCISFVPFFVVFRFDWCEYNT